MDAFLKATTARLDDSTQVPDERLEELYRTFLSAMRKSYMVFDDHAFRKWPTWTESRNPINRPLFESWSYAVGSYDADDLMHRKGDIVAAARQLMTDDQAYLDAISTSTGDPRKVRLRFERAAQAASAERTQP